MGWVITFRTRRFDVAAEQPNPINPIAGQGVLRWLTPGLTEAGYRVGEPATEDWGWYVDAERTDGSYLVGASGEPGGPGDAIEWVVQVHRSRSLGDKLRGRHRLEADDELCVTIERLLSSEPDIEVLVAGLDD